MNDKRIFRTSFLCMLFLTFIASLLGCGKTEPVGEEVILSYISTQKTKLVETKTYLVEEGVLAQIDEVLTLLATPSLRVEYYAPLSQEVSVISRSFMDGRLAISFSEAYKDLDAATEILTRASIVKSLTQIESVEKVAFYIKGEPLKDKLNKEVGTMTASMFIDG